MADMKIAMTLTLRDLASPELQKFQDLIKTTQDMLKPFNDQLKILQDGMNGATESVNRALGPFRAFNITLQRSVVNMGAAGDAAKVMAGSMLAGADGAAKLGAASAGAAAGIAAVGDAAGIAHDKVAGLHGTMKGLVELYGAFKIGQALHKSVDVASSYQQERVHMQLMGIPAGAQAQMLRQAQRLQQIPGVSRLAGLEASLGGYAAVPGSGAAQTQIRNALMPEALKAAMVLKSSFGDRTPVGTIVRNILGSVEMMGKLENIPQALQGIREVLQIAEGSHGKITPINLETSLRNMPFGLALRLSKKGLFREAALHEQMKAAGGAGGAGGNTKSGTVAGMISSMMSGGLISIGQSIMLEEMGLLNAHMVKKIPGTSRVWINPGILPHSVEGQRDPIKWVHDVLVPAAAALEHKLHPAATPAALKNDVINWLVAYGKTSGGTNVGMGGVLSAEAEQYARLTNTYKQMMMAATPAKGIHDLQGTLSFKTKEMLAKLETVGVQIGTALLPALQALATLATGAAHALSTLNRNWPIFAKIEAWAGALAAVLLGIKGVEWLMGVRDGFRAIKAVKLGAALISWSGKLVGLTGSIGMLSAKMLGAAGAAGALGYAIGTALNLGINRVGQAITGNSHWSLGGQVFHWTHTSPGHYAAMRMHPTAPPGAMNNNPGDLMAGGHLAHYANPGAGLYAMASMLRGKAHGNPTVLDHLMRTMMVAKGTLHYFSPSSIMTVARMVATSAPVVNHSLLNEQTHMAAMTAAAGHAPGLGYTGPVTAAGLQKAASLKAKAASHAAALHAATVNHINAAFRQRLNAQTRLTNIASNIRAQYQGIFGTLPEKIPVILHKYRMIAREIGVSHPHAAEMAMAVAHHQILGVRYQSAMGSLHGLQGTMHLGVTNNAALVKAGAMSHATAAQRDIALEQQMAPQMLKAAEAAMKYAKALKDPALVRALQEQIAGIRAMGAQLGFYQVKLKGVAKHAFSGLFTQMLRGQQTWAQMLHNFLGTISAGIGQIIAKKLSTSITGALFGNSSKHHNSLNSAIGWLFGGGNSPAAGTGASASKGGGGAMSWISHIFGGGNASAFSAIGSWLGSLGLSFATGADYIPHTMVAQLHQGEMVLPAAAAANVRSGAMGGAGHTVNLSIHALDSQSVLQAMHPIARDLAGMLNGTGAYLNLGGA